MGVIRFGSPTVIKSVSTVHSGLFIQLLTLSLSLSLYYNIRGCGKQIF